MKKLLFKSFLLLFPFLLMVGYSEYQLRLVPNSYSVKLSQLRKQADSIKLLILGSSHAHHGINPAKFELPAYNMANVSQSLYYDTRIIQQELNRLKSLKVVILPISYFSLESSPAPSLEEWRYFFYLRFYGIPLPVEVDRYYSVFDLRRYSLIALYGYQDSRRFFMKRFKKINLAEQVGPDGWYPIDYIPTAVISEETGKQRAEFHQAGMAPSNISTNIGYLTTIIELLRRKGVTPVLLTLPVYGTYYSHVNETSYNTLCRETAALAAHYGVRYINYFRDSRFDRNDFFDNDHLNRNGATKLSILLNAEIMSDRFLVK